MQKKNTASDSHPSGGHTAKTEHKQSTDGGCAIQERLPISAPPIRRTNNGDQHVSQREVLLRSDDRIFFNRSAIHFTNVVREAAVRDRGSRRRVHHHRRRRSVRL